MNGSRDKLISPRALIRLASVPLVAILLVLVGSDRTEAAPGPPCKCFVPNPTLTLSTTDPGSHPDLVGTFNIGVGPDGQVLTADDTGDYNFGGVLQFAPTSPTDAASVRTVSGAVSGGRISRYPLSSSRRSTASWRILAWCGRSLGFRSSFRSRAKKNCRLSA